MPRKPKPSPQPDPGKPKPKKRAPRPKKAKAESKNPSGAEHEPTETTRMQVRLASGFGLPHKMIARLIGLGSSNTLEKHYADELATGEAEATFKVAKGLFMQATREKDPSLAAMIFWLKARAGWREKHVLDDDKVQSNLAQLIAMSGLDDTPKAPEAWVEPKPAAKH